MKEKQMSEIPKLQLPPVMIVSIFGRGLALAESLRHQGIPTAVVDLSHRMGSLDAEEIEGPFPLFKNNDLNRFQLQAWGLQAETGGENTEIPQGFCLLTGAGPLEFASPQLENRLQAMGIKKASPESKSKFDSQAPLGEVWPLHLSSSFCALANVAPMEALRLAPGISLQTPICVRPAGYYQNKIAEMKENEGPLFQMITKTDIEDLVFKDRQTVAGVLLKKERSEILPLSQLIWTLSAAETKFVSERLFQRIFSAREFTPQMAWMKWSFRLPIVGIPDYFLILDDPELPWSHQNYLILKRINADFGYAIWNLLPADQRFNRSYLENETGLLQRFLQKRFPFCKPELLQVPSETHSTFQEKGPALHAHYLPGVIESQRQPKLKHFHTSAFESRVSQGPNAEFSRESEIEMDIVKWWTKELELARKREAKLAKTEEIAP